MSKNSLVSTIIIFLNGERFLEEALKSVLAQTYVDWELLLVDDGSTDKSTEIARCYAGQYPEKIRYLEHPNHQNRGMSATRNLGIRSAKGSYIAFLDADDYWLPYKLEAQVKILDSCPDVGALFSNSMYWYSWTGRIEDKTYDFVPDLGIKADRIYYPPSLLPLFLCGEVAVPCINSLLVRLDPIDRIGGFEESFRTMYEDQAFYAKLCLSESIYVSTDCLDWYRQHTSSATALSYQEGTIIKTRAQYLLWLKDYLTREHVVDIKVWKALHREIWRISSPKWLPENNQIQKTLRWIKKWILKSEERLIPQSIRNRLWD
jgi:glycosyltransferase involved in cell wall biosynthesis